MPDLINLTEQLAMDGYEYAYALSTFDLTGNGLPDIITPDTDVGLYWLENHGNGNFTRHVIHRKENEWLERHQVVDINGDGRPEIVTVDNISASLLYFAYDGDPRLPASWQFHYIDEGTIPGAYAVAVADLTGNGALDVAATNWRKGNQVLWYENTGSDWTKHIIEDDIAETRDIHAVDINGNGKIDLLATARVGNQLAWYENTGNPARQGWRKHIIDDAPQPIHGRPVDMDGDGDVDIVMALGMLPPGEKDGAPFEHHQVVWYEHEGDPAAGKWRKHIICDKFPHAFEAIAADLDGDGQLEVIATAWNVSGRVAVFKHRGDPRGPWDMQLLKDGWTNANMVITADLTGNGRLDIIAAAERGSNEVRWWRNDGA
ncbi:MAG: VCBS repeat-containing protein [Caldilineaceae bacterium]|nr:VCBS repeat-containing protein [Caldilineaceae bacterium]